MTSLPQTTPMRLPRPNPTQLAIPAANGHGGPMALHAPGGSGVGQAAAMTGADVWRVLRANLWLILLIVAAFGVAGFFLNMWLAAKYARYTSTALIRVQLESELPRIDEQSRTLIAEPSPQSIELEQQSQANMLLNKYFLGSLLEDPNSDIRKTDWFRQWGAKVEDAKEDLQDKLSVVPRPNTRLIEVSMSCASPRDAQVIVREIVNRHIADRKQKVQDLQVRKSQDLQSMIEHYKGEQENNQSELARLARDLADKGMSIEGSGALDYELPQALAQKERAQEEYGKANEAVKVFVQSVKEGLTPAALQRAMAGTPGGTSGVDGMVLQLEAEKAAIAEQQGDNSPRVKSLERQIQTLKDKHDELQGGERDKMVAAVKMDLEADLLAAQDNLRESTKVVDDLQKARSAAAAGQTRATQLKELDRNTRENLQKAQDEYNKLELFIQQNNWATAEMAMQPELPDKPSFPKLWVTMTLAIGLGLMASIGLAFLRELMDTSVRSPRDITRVGQLNLLGMIPHEADDPEAAAARLPLAIYEAPQSVIAEQFRQVRTRLQHSASLDTVRSLLVTGTAPNDGKTTVACNLAAGLALNGRRILLVDANFRRPQLHAAFNLSNDLGFADVLNSLDVFDEAVRETEVPNLSVLPSGAKPANPTELLESQLLIDFIERALEEYDHVIFDSGPLLIVSETAALAPRVDGVVTVVRAGSNSRGMLQRLRDQIRQLKAEHLGVILNAVRAQSGGYYAPMIKTYYAYQQNG